MKRLLAVLAVATVAFGSAPAGASTIPPSPCVGKLSQVFLFKHRAVARETFHCKGPDALQLELRIGDNEQHAWRVLADINLTPTVPAGTTNFAVSVPCKTGYWLTDVHWQDKVFSGVEITAVSHLICPK
jgi:hypothetical protein